MYELNKMLEKVEQRDKELTALDFNPNRSVFLQHDDGSILFLNSAFYETIDNFIVIFSEHHGPIWYHKGDVVIIDEITREYEHKNKE